MRDRFAGNRVVDITVLIWRYLPARLQWWKGCARCRFCGADTDQEMHSLCSSGMVNPKIRLYCASKRVLICAGPPPLAAGQAAPLAVRDPARNTAVQHDWSRQVIRSRACAHCVNGLFPHRCDKAVHLLKAICGQQTAPTAHHLMG